MLLACANCFMVPVEVAVDLSFDESSWYKMLNLAIDTIFILDILVNFNTSYSKELDTIYDRKLIARKYMKTRFTVDILSAVPLDLIAGIFFSM